MSARAAVAAALFLAAGTTAVAEEPAPPCKGAPAIVAACFTVHGRLGVYNGIPIRIWVVGTRRMLGAKDASGGGVTVRPEIQTLLSRASLARPSSTATTRCARSRRLIPAGCSSSASRAQRICWHAAGPASAVSPRQPSRHRRRDDLEVLGRDHEEPEAELISPVPRARGETELLQQGHDRRFPARGTSHIAAERAKPAARRTNRARPRLRRRSR